ncbi:MAG: hypothetical protein MJ060_03985, partial [Clostridia bacterium]|nr:hypothetical protein [Clostridia bacterium]
MAKKIKLAKSRKLAYKWICATFSRDAYLREIIDADRAHIFGSGKIDAKQNGQASSYSNAISKADFDYAQKLAFYVVMTYGTLDELLDLCLESDQKIKNNLKYAFRLSAAESLYLDKEDYIVVSQGVELVRSFNRHADKFANAILRKVCQKAKTFAGDAASELQKYSRLYGLPQDFIELVIAEHGQDFALKYFDTNLQVAPTHLVNFCVDKS